MIVRLASKICLRYGRPYCGRLLTYTLLIQSIGIHNGCTTEPSESNIASEFRDATAPATNPSPASDSPWATSNENQTGTMQSGLTSNSTSRPQSRSRSVTHSQGSAQGDLSVLGACEDQSCCPDGYSQKLGNWRGNFMKPVR